METKMDLLKLMQMLLSGGVGQVKATVVPLPFQDLGYEYPRDFEKEANLEDLSLDTPVQLTVGDLVQLFMMVQNGQIPKTKKAEMLSLPSAHQNSLSTYTISETNGIQPIRASAVVKSVTTLPANPKQEVVEVLKLKKANSGFTPTDDSKAQSVDARKALIDFLKLRRPQP